MEDHQQVYSTPPRKSSEKKVGTTDQKWIPFVHEDLEPIVVESELEYPLELDELILDPHSEDFADTDEDRNSLTSTVEEPLIDQKTPTIAAENEDLTRTDESDNLSATDEEPTDGDLNDAPNPEHSGNPPPSVDIHPKQHPLENIDKSSSSGHQDTSNEKDEEEEELIQDKKPRKHDKIKFFSGDNSWTTITLTSHEIRRFPNNYNYVDSSGNRGGVHLIPG